MTGDLKYRTYPAYRPSGIEWLGEVPDHWEKTHIKRLARQGYKTFIDGDWIESPFITNDGIRLIQTGNVGVGEYREQGFRYITEDTFRELKCTEVYPGDILICRLAEPVGRACIAPTMSSRMITCVDVCILKPRVEYDARFIVYSLSSEEYISWMQAICRGGTRDRVSRYMLGAIDFVLPSPEEQHAIADFLDRETAKIDALLAKKERLIELLQEKRTALISHAVTKGLDPTVSMKDSGVEWLGEIPAHWEVKRLKYVVKNGLVNGVFKKQDQFGSGVKLINVFDIYRDDFLIDFESLERVEVDQEEIQRYKVEDGDIFFVRSSLKLEGVATSACTIGVSEPIVFECHIIRARPDAAKAIPKFLISFLNSKLARQRLIALSETVTMTTIDQNNLQSTEILVPPLDEQITIIGFLDRETSRIDRLIAKVRGGIERLKEYRTALISAAVTGKIDVRNFL